MKYFEKIKELRVQLPISIKEAEKLLMETNGNIDMVQQLFKINMLNIFVKKIDINKEEANKYLNTSNYDFTKAILLYEKDRYNIAELCLRKNKSKKEALYKLLLSIEQKYNHNFWLFWQKDNMPLLSGVEHTFVVLMNWIEYENWEGDIIIDEKIVTSWKTLNLVWLSNLIEDVLKIIKDQDQSIKEYWNYDEYKLLRITFLEREIEIIDCLYNYVEENIHSF